MIIAGLNRTSQTLTKSKTCWTEALLLSAVRQQRLARQPCSSKSGQVIRRQQIKTACGDVDGVWYSTHGTQSTSLEMGRYGLTRLDYKTLDPPVWLVPPHPPTKSIQERVVFPLTLLIVAGFGFWVYMNPEEEDMRDYWKRVETGQILVEDDVDDEVWEDEDED